MITDLDPQRKRAEVVAEAYSWIGTPFHHEGRVKGAGVDCGYFAMMVHANSGTCPYVEFPHYSAQWLMHHRDEMYVREISKLTREVAEPLPGDIVLFKIAHVFGHGGIVVDWPTKIIHANDKSGVELADATKYPFFRLKRRFFSPWA